MAEIENPHGIGIDLTQFTDKVTMGEGPDYEVTGTGIYDILMEVNMKHLQSLIKRNGWREENFADTYPQIMQATMGAALQIWLQKPLAKWQEESEKAKKALYYRQIEGLDEDYKNKVLKIMVDGWGMGFATASDNPAFKSLPGLIQAGTINEIFNTKIVPDMEAYDYGRDIINTVTNPTGEKDATGQDYLDKIETLKLLIMTTNAAIADTVNPASPENKQRLTYMRTEYERQLAIFEAKYQAIKNSQTT